METNEPLPVSIDDLPEVESSYPAPFDREKLAYSKDVGTALGTIAMGMHHERLPPGRRTTFTHAHSHEEEVIVVLSGECRMRIVPREGEPYELTLRPMSAISFRPGTGIAHTFVNRSAADCTLLVVGTRNSADRIFYPEDSAYDSHLRQLRPSRHWDLLAR